MKMKRFSTIGLLLASILLASACGGGESSQINPEELAEPIADMANPAAVYCGGLGYAMENVTRNGGEDADCIFPDESRCGQWDFISGRCGQEFSYCSLQGYNLGEGTNIGTCQFPDGSTCDEFLFFSGDCSPGDNPAVVVEEEPIHIQDISEARDYLTAYFSNQYGVEALEPWIEQNITPEDSVGSYTVRFVSGPLTIVISALASAPSPSEYTIKEAANISNGFYWEGSLSISGEISETRVIPPGSIFNEAQARDGVLEFIAANYDLHTPEDWIDQGITQAEKGKATALGVFTSGSWVVEVEFEPAAPLISSYQIRIENLSEGIYWEGEINLQGEIREISYQKYVEEEPIHIQDISEARDYLVAYLSDQYGIERNDPWMEANITPADAAGVTTFRYVSGPLWIVISAEASAPYPAIYTIQEASYIANGFRWEGTLAIDGTIVDTKVVPPWPILNTDQARDAVLDYLVETYDMPHFGSWVDEGVSQTGNDTVVRRYSSESWIVTVEFIPAAPLVSSYNVIVENNSEGIRWEGDISGQGEITETSYLK